MGGRGGLLNARVPGGAAEGAVIRSRPGLPADRVCHDPATGGRKAAVDAAYPLTEQQLLDLMTLQLADWLQQVVAVNNEPRTSRMPHAMSGQPGFWEVPPGGWHAYRRDSWHAIAEVLGGAALVLYERVFAELEAGGAPPAIWHAGDLTQAQLEAWDGRGTDQANL